MSTPRSTNKSTLQLSPVHSAAALQTPRTSPPYGLTHDGIRLRREYTGYRMTNLVSRYESRKSRQRGKKKSARKVLALSLLHSLWCSQLSIGGNVKGFCIGRLYVNYGTRELFCEAWWTGCSMTDVRDLHGLTMSCQTLVSRLKLAPFRVSHIIHSPYRPLRIRF